MQKNNRAKILLDKINNEFSLVTLKEDSKKLLDKASLYDIIIELAKFSNKKEEKILNEAVSKLKLLGIK